MAGNKSFKNAKKDKNDEFYTQLSDIENELKHYKKEFKGKTVFCNCDDPYESNFFKYFALFFNFLGLKKLIATCYSSSPVVGDEIDYNVDKNGQIYFFENENTATKSDKKPYKIEITEVSDLNGDGAVDLADVEYLLKNDKNTLTLLEGDGDFRSEECIQLLKEADIVVTNPPFSLFREYIAQLVEYNKKFLVIGGQNALTYKEIFTLIKQNKLWLGYYSGDMSFTVPEYYEERETRFWIDEKGQKWRSLGNICWYTNLDTKKRHEDILLYRTYNAEEYPKYDNYDAINVNKVADIPFDYDGVMGVPITFLDKYNPDQFEILGMCSSAGYDKNVVGIDKIGDFKDSRPLLNGKNTYARIFIRKKK